MHGRMTTTRQISPGGYARRVRTAAAEGASGMRSAAARPDTVRLADAVVEAVVEQYSDPGSHDHDVLLLIATHPSLREAFLGAAAEIEHPLAAVIAERIGDTDQCAARVFSASVAAAVLIALERWLRPAGASPSASGLVVPSGSLPELLRSALAPLRPALDAAESDDHRSRPSDGSGR